MHDPYAKKAFLKHAPKMIHHISEKRLPAHFYRTERGNEPVREWLRDLGKDDRRIIGADIMTVEYGWPIGMPTCRPMGDGRWTL